MRRCALPWGMAALVVCAAAAHGAPPSSKELAAQRAHEGEQLGNSKDFVGALKKFREAVSLDPDTPAYACNVGMAHYALNHYPRAHLWLTRCKNQSGGSFSSAGVAQVFHFVETQLQGQDFTPLTITTRPNGARVTVEYFSDEGPSTAPITMFVAFGRHNITVEADGYQTIHDSIDATDRTLLTRSYTLEEAAAPAGTDASHAAPVPDASGAGAGSPADPDLDPASAASLTQQDTRTGHSTLHWWLLGAGGALLVAAGVTEGVALHYYAAGSGKEADPNYGDDFYDKNIAWQHRTLVLGAAGAAVGLVGAYLWYRDKHRAPLTVTATPTDQGAAVLFTWTH